MEEKRYVVWSLDLEQKLLKSWRSRRCLFDPNSFVTKSERQEALGELAAEIGVTEEDVWKHMTSLRTQYSRCMRIDSAAATTPRQKWLIRELGFLRPYIKKRLRTSTHPRTMHYNRQTSRQAGYATHEKFVDEALPGDLDFAPVAVVDNVQTSPSIDLELMAADETLGRDDDSQSVLLADDDGAVPWDEDHEPAETVPALTAAGGRRLVCGDGGSVNVDDDAVFGQLVVCELRHVTDPATKLVLRHRILAMIYEARLGCLQGARSGQHLAHAVSAHPSLPRLVEQGSRRPIVNGCRSFSRLAHSVHDSDIDSADAVNRPLNYAFADNETIVIKEEF